MNPESRPLSPRGALTLLAVCMPIWGINWPVMKIALGSIPPVWLAEVRMASTSACLFVALAITRRLRLPGRQDLPAIVSVGVFMMGIYPVLTMTGLLYAEAGRASLLSFVTPLWVTPAAILILGERPTRLKLAGVATGLIGLGVLFNPIGFDWSKGDVILGNGLLLLASISWAVTILHLRRHRWRLSPLELSPWQLLVAAAVIAPTALWLEAGKPVLWSVDLFAILVFSGPVATVLTIWGAIVVLRSLPAITSSLAFLATPVFGMLASALVLGETLTVTNLTGLALIVTGLGVVAWSEARSASAR